MRRIAILGGGIAGLSAAYELEVARRAGAPVDWHLFEASNRLGGTLHTTRHQTPEGEYILEDGPDGWVTEKPWARELAVELGLGPDLIHSIDATRKTYILQNGRLLPIPDRMRLMVPEDLSTLRNSPLFSVTAKQAYASERTRAAELKVIAPAHDESVATFTLRHFGPEVLANVAAPLLAGVFGGDVYKLSVRAVMPQFVAMERDHGSLVAALQAKAATRTSPPQPIFTSLRHGMASLVEALAAQLPPERLHLNRRLKQLRNGPRWQLILDDTTFRPEAHPHPLQAGHTFDEVILATPLNSTRPLLAALDDGHRAATLLPIHASSATLAAFTWPPELAQTFTLPPGFGFLVPPTPHSDSSPQLLACTFVDQKFPHRAPAGARILRAFFGSGSTEFFANQPDAEVASLALTQLRPILGPLPDPTLTTVARWPHSLPQYEVGHLDRMAQLHDLTVALPGLHLLGNSYHGVGVPDLIRDARRTARTLIQGLKT